MQNGFSDVAEGDKYNSVGWNEWSECNPTFVQERYSLAESEQQTYANVDVEFVRHFQRRVTISIWRRQGKRIKILLKIKALQMFARI